MTSKYEDKARFDECEFRVSVSVQTEEIYLTPLIQVLQIIVSDLWVINDLYDMPENR